MSLTETNFTHEWGRLTAWLESNTRDRDQAEDVASDAVLRVLVSGCPDGKEQAFLRHVAKWELKSYYRRQTRDRERQLAWAEIELPSVRHSHDQRENTGLDVARRWDVVGIEDREVLIVPLARCRKPLTDREIAWVDCPVCGTTFKPRMKKGQRKMTCGVQKCSSRWREQRKLAARARVA